MDFSTRTIRFPATIDDQAIAHFHQQADLVTQSEADIVLVDFSDVEFMSSTGLMALVMAFKKVRAENKRLFLCSTNEQVRMLLELTGMDEVFEIFERVKEPAIETLTLVC